MLIILNYVLQSGNPPESWSEVIITVIQKEAEDPLQCCYSSISLSWVDYKIDFDLNFGKQNPDVY